MLLALLLSSCDRFEHSFAPVATEGFQETFYSPLEDAFNEMSVSNMDIAMDFFADDYMHFGVSKANRRDWLQNILISHEQAIFEVSEVSSMLLDENHAVTNWRLQVILPDRFQAVVDSTFVGDKLEKIAGKWRLRGNNMCNPPSNKQLVIAEYFTFRTCPNCPEAETKLYALQQQYAGKFIFLEYHIDPNLLPYLPGDNTYLYYTAYTPPATVFQGMHKVLQSNAAALAQYQSIVDELVQVDTPITYQMGQQSINGNQINTSVQLTPVIELDQSNLVLNYAIISDETTYVNYNGDPLHNVVRAKGSLSLNGVDLANPVNISLTAANPLPEHFTLVVWAQKKPGVFQNNSTIYGGITSQWTNSSKGKR